MKNDSAEMGGYYFDVQAYRASDKVRLMDYETRGIYREVLDEIWVTGSVPTDLDSISRLIHAPLDVIVRTWPKIHDCLMTVRDTPERLTSERMEFEKKRRNRIRKERAKSGSAGGKASAEQRRSKVIAIASANGAANVEHSSTNPIPIPIPSIGKGKEEESGFEEFWKLYPKHKGKEDARKAWKKLGPHNGMREIIYSAIRAQRQSSDWLKDSGSFIPYPATWLNGKRWDDEITTGPRPDIVI